MDLKNYRFNSFGEKIFIEPKETVDKETPEEQSEEYYKPFEEDDEESKEESSIDDSIYSLIFECLGEYEDDLSIYVDDVCFIKHNPSEKSLEIFYNSFDKTYSGFIFNVPIGGRMHFINNIDYVKNGLHDDIFDTFITELINTYDLNNKSPYVSEMNNYLDLLNPPSLLKDENFWTIYQRIKKEFGQAHFKDGFIYFDDVRCFINNDTILYMGYKEYDIEKFIEKYKAHKYDNINFKFKDNEEFASYIIKTFKVCEELKKTG